MKRESFQALHEELSRRGFLKLTASSAGVVLAWDRFGSQLFGAASDFPLATKVMSGIGDLIVPVDQDPGWLTFEPGITDYALNVFVKQVLFGGNQVAFDAVLGTFAVFNEAPVTILYGSQFLDMSPPFRARYFTDVLTGAFENDGFQDVLFTAAGIGMFVAKAVFFSNYPNHLAILGAEYQTRPPSPVRTGWDIMNFKGPLGPQEEKALRDKFFDVEEIPGVDPRNPYI